MNRQRKVLITATYNELGIIIDTKAEEVAQPDLQSTCNQLATDCISRQAAIVVFENSGLDDDSKDTVVRVLEQLPSAQPVNYRSTKLDSSSQLKLNNDLISRQAVIDTVSKWFYDVFGITESDGTATIFKRLRALPPAQPQWIPCSERLPEANGRYLVTRGLKACGALWNRTYIINYSDLMGLKKEKIWWSGNVGKSDFERYDDVIAWMPLPKPYGGESE